MGGVGTDFWVGSYLQELEKYMPGSQKILMLDFAPGHYGSRALEYMKESSNITFAFVPAGQTAMSQPLDQCVFGRAKGIMHSAALRTLMARFLATGELPSRALSAAKLRQMTLDAVATALHRLQADALHVEEIWKCFTAIGYTLSATGEDDYMMKLPGYGTGDACKSVRNTTDREDADDITDEVVNFSTAEELMALVGPTAVENQPTEIGGWDSGDGAEMASGRMRRQAEPDEPDTYDQNVASLNEVLEAMEDESALVVPDKRTPRFVIPSLPVRGLIPGVNWDDEISRLPELGGRKRRTPTAELVKIDNPVAKWGKPELVEYCNGANLARDGSLTALRRRVFRHKMEQAFNLTESGAKSEMVGQLYDKTKPELVKLCKRNGLPLRGMAIKEEVLLTLLNGVLSTDNPWSMVDLEMPADALEQVAVSTHEDIEMGDEYGNRIETESGSRASSPDISGDGNGAEHMDVDE